MADSLLEQLKHIVNTIDDGSSKPCSPCPASAPCCSGPVCCTKPLCAPPCPFPYLQVCMLTPPPCPVPTQPKYVKPLTLPCPPNCNECKHDPETDFNTRFANFYNYYNTDYHCQEGGGGGGCGKNASKSGSGVTVDGKKPQCEDYRQKRIDCSEDGCPTGFKPCTMKLCPPACCNPLNPWQAEVLPCPAKPRKKVSIKYTPGPCTRPCCKHWQPKEGPCLYDKPCKAHCYNHPPGIKASNC